LNEQAPWVGTLAAILIVAALVGWLWL